MRYWIAPSMIALLAALVPAGKALADDERASNDAWLSRGVKLLLDMQEGEQNAEWPYEGVYRVRREIPIGYRVGGTAIVATALLHAPGLEEDHARRDAISRAVDFIVGSVDHPLMSHDVEATYDVRGWGFAYGLWFLAQAEQAAVFNDQQRDAAQRAIAYFIEGIIATEIPRFGGWNYARRGGFTNPGPPSPFMTGSTVQALLEAARAGYDVPQDLIDRALDSIEAAKTESGSYVYSGRAGDRSRTAVPGAVGRMLVAEATLHLAGRSSVSDVRGALDAFFVHWDWLERRRAQTGTHVPPYGIAPYYFYFAHFYAAQAIEMLPEHDRAEYRRRLHELFERTRNDDGSWNDRVFPRSANYGTAMVMLAVMMPDLPAPPRRP